MGGLAGGGQILAPMHWSIERERQPNLPPNQVAGQRHRHNYINGKIIKLATKNVIQNYTLSQGYWSHDQGCWSHDYADS